MADKQREVVFDKSPRGHDFRVWCDLTFEQVKAIEGVRSAYNHAGGLPYSVNVDPRYDIADIKAEIERLAQPKTNKRRVRDVKREIEAHLFDRPSTYSVNASIGNPLTIVAVTTRCGLVGVGSAACCALDKFDPSMGLKIAIGRAALDLAEQIVEE